MNASMFARVQHECVCSVFVCLSGRMQLRECVCACVCICACVRACMYACMYVWYVCTIVCEYMCVRVCVCVRAYVWNSPVKPNQTVGTTLSSWRTPLPPPHSRSHDPLSDLVGLNLGAGVQLIHLRPVLAAVSLLQEVQQLRIAAVLHHAKGLQRRLLASHVRWFNLLAPFCLGLPHAKSTQFSNNNIGYLQRPTHTDPKR